MHDVFFGLFLLENKAVEPDVVFSALRNQRRFNRCIGELAIGRGYLTPDQAEKLFAAQASDRRHFGTIAVEKGFVSPEDLDELLFLQTVHCRRLGELLYDSGALREPDYSRLLGEYKEREGEERRKLEEHLAQSEDQGRMQMMLGALSLTLARFSGVVCKPVAGVEPGEGLDVGEYGRVGTNGDGEYGCQTILADAGEGGHKPLKVIFSRRTLELLLMDLGGDQVGDHEWLDTAQALFGRSGVFSGCDTNCLVRALECVPVQKPEPCAEGVTMYLGLQSGDVAVLYVYPPESEFARAGE